MQKALQMFNSFTTTLKGISSRIGYIRQRFKLQCHINTSLLYRMSTMEMARHALTMTLCTTSSRTWLTQLQEKDNMKRLRKQKRTNQKHGHIDNNHDANQYSTMVSEQQTKIRPFEAQRAIQRFYVRGCVHRRWNFTKFGPNLHWYAAIIQKLQM